jgi:hypothetical protein
MLRSSSTSAMVWAMAPSTFTTRPRRVKSLDAGDAERPIWRIYGQNDTWTR